MPRARPPGRDAGDARDTGAAHIRVRAVRDAVKALARALEILGCDDPTDRGHKFPSAVGKSQGGASGAARPRFSPSTEDTDATGDTGAPSAARRRRERRARATARAGEAAAAADHPSAGSGGVTPQKDPSSAGRAGEDRTQ